MNRRRILARVLWGVLVTAGAIIFLLPLFDAGDLQLLFAHINYTWLYAGFLSYALAYIMRVLRFRALLPKNVIAFSAMTQIASAHAVAVRILPNPFGELFFVSQTKQAGIQYSSSISALIIYRALDFIVVSLLLMVGSIMLIPATKLSALIAALFGGAIASITIILIIVISFYQGPLMKVRDYIANRFPKRATAIVEKSNSVMRALSMLREREVYKRAVFYSFLVWGLMMLSYGFFFKAAGISLPSPTLITGGTTQILMNTLPNIAGIGTMEAGWLLGLRLGNVALETALLGAIVVDFATLVGTFAIWGIVAISLASARKYKKLYRSKRIIRGALASIIGMGSLLWILSFKINFIEGQVRFFQTYPNIPIEAAWTEYRSKIQKDGRTIDRNRNYLTTSEGQSYSLLRAVWMDDKATFDRVLNWTNHNLRKRPNDKLFAWLWGKNASGRWDVMYEDGGINTASDADQDIALALIFAKKRWNQSNYLTQARQILNDIWSEEVVIIQGKPYLVAGNWANEEQAPTVNPSYFSFAAYPIFAEVDPAHQWMLLKETSYNILNETEIKKLDADTSAKIPPDWISLNLETGSIMSPSHKDKTTNFSDDAFRVLWRVALDWEWHRDPRAKEYLDSQAAFFENEWKQRGKIYNIYTHAGEPLSFYESASVYATVASSFASVHQKFARDVFNEKVASLYDPDTESLSPNLGYYPQNWVWFGMALYSHNLTNLFLIE